MGKFTIGADPEVLLSNGIKYVSAIGVVPGSKDFPKDLGLGSVHPDNVTAEFNTLPANDKAGFSASVANMLSAVEDIVAVQDLIISKQASASFDADQLQHPDAMMAGCEPDFNAYTCMMNEMPPLDGTSVRSAGGHIHIGCELNSGDELLKLVKTLDLLISVPAMRHESKDRKKLYGRAGTFRQKPYGVEYRTPSNWWIFSEEHRQWIYDRVASAVDSFKDIVLPDNLQAVIDDNDSSAADKIMSQYNLVACPN